LGKTCKKIVKKISKENFQETKPCAKINGMFLTLITIKLQIIIRNQSLYMFLGYVRQRKINSIYLTNSTKSNYKLIEDFQG